jgi:pimeloyl-ACP methyl ester carboxylesterase
VVSDIGAVIDSLGVGQVHLLAHDWGSIQTWAAVTDESVMGKIASFTSISGPHLQYAGKFLRSARTPRTVSAGLLRDLQG